MPLTLHGCQKSIHYSIWAGRVQTPLGRTWSIGLGVGVTGPSRQSLTWGFVLKPTATRSVLARAPDLSPALGGDRRSQGGSETGFQHILACTCSIRVQPCASPRLCCEMLCIAGSRISHLAWHVPAPRADRSCWPSHYSQEGGMCGRSRVGLQSHARKGENGASRFSKVCPAYFLTVTASGLERLRAPRHSCAPSFGSLDSVT